MSTRLTSDPRQTYLTIGAVLVGLVIIGLTYVVFRPLVAAAPADKVQPVELPAYDDSAWHGLAVQHGGRTKPFESAAIEAVREITGRAKFEGKDAVRIVLSWWAVGGDAPGALNDKWESHPFIACDHHGLRSAIYAHLEGEDIKPEVREEQLHGKYISPADLRSSPGLEQLLKEAHGVRRQDPEKAQQNMSPEQRKAEEVVTRLALYDSLCGRPWTELHNFLLVGHQLEDKLNAVMLKDRLREHPDPLHVVALDLVPGSAWFSLGELRYLMSLPEKAERPEQKTRADKWAEIMQERVAREPQRYLSPERKRELHEFQQAVREGRAREKLDELEARLRQRDEQTAAEIDKLWQEGEAGKAKALDQIAQLLKNQEERQRLIAVLHGQEKDPKSDKIRAVMVRELRGILGERTRNTTDDLRRRADLAKQRNIPPEHDDFRMLNLNYIENLHPGLYREAVGWQKFPADKAKEVLDGFAAVQAAYYSGNAEQFREASEGFLAKLQDVSDRTLIASYVGSERDELRKPAEEWQQAVEKGDTTAAEAAKERFVAAFAGTPEASARYPGVTTVGLEMSFNRLQPFMWAWVLMFVGLLCFVIVQTLPSFVSAARAFYGLGFAFFFGSLAFQVFGFFTRIYISGRPPVSNMYETVIWVSFMSSLFALVLELVYRRNVIILAGSLVATVGLVLADQLPLALDPKISPLVPVLRSNFWLIIHVLTIVSSYAGGTLAWGLANVSLALLAFGRPSQALLKTLSQYTYRAMQIAVLLLAAGTFLGGWWAAYSWGRFWGWDPKEVWALIALVTYVIPLHMRYVGWVKDFGLAVSAVLCYAAIVMCWYGVNFVLGAGLHSYGFGGGGPWWVFWAGMVNVEWVLIASMLYIRRQPAEGLLAPMLAGLTPGSQPAADPTGVISAADKTGLRR